MGFSQLEVANLFSCDKRTIQRYDVGEADYCGRLDAGEAFPPSAMLMAMWIRAHDIPLYS
jgi:hypothetical protein